MCIGMHWGTPMHLLPVKLQDSFQDNCRYHFNSSGTFLLMCIQKSTFYVTQSVWMQWNLTVDWQEKGSFWLPAVAATSWFTPGSDEGMLKSLCNLLPLPVIECRCFCISHLLLCSPDKLLLYVRISWNENRGLFLIWEAVSGLIGC